MADFILPETGGTVQGSEGDDTYIFDPRSLATVIVTDLGGSDTFRVLNTPDRDAGQFLLDGDTLIFRSLQGGEVRFELGSDRAGMIETFQWELDPGDPGTRLDLRVATAPAALTDFGVAYAGTDGDDVVLDRGDADGASGWTDIYGNAGDDRLTASGFHQTYLYGGEGDDTLSGAKTGRWDDSLFGDGGNDLLRGREGEDFLYGGAGNDRIEGGARADSLMGEGGADSLFGGGGADFLAGREGRDRLEGQDGRDYLDGGAGADTLLGGKLTDTFIYDVVTDSRAGRANRDRIEDFNPFLDMIDLRDLDGDATIEGRQALRFDRDGLLETGEIARVAVKGGMMIRIETGMVDGVDMEIFLARTGVIGTDAFFL